MTRFESHPILSRGGMSALMLLALFLILGDSSPISAQNPMSCHAMDTREAIAPEKLPPPEKLTGIGNSHLRITATPEA